MKATAAVFDAPGAPLRLQSFALPQRLAAGEALVELELCTLCGSDLHSIRGDREVPRPTVLGHEVVGHLVEIAEGGLRDIDGGSLSIGDRVSWAINAACGECFYCRQGLPQKCENTFKYGHRAIDDSHPLSGGLASHCHLAPGTALVRVPHAVSLPAACPANCATATAAAALRAAGECRGRCVVVHGAGLLGLTVAAMARAAGATLVFVSERSAPRRRLAEQFGATHTELGKLIEQTGGRGADIAFDMCGSPEAIESSIGQLRTGGRLILVGAVFPARPLAIHAEQIVRKLLRIEGVHNYTPADLAIAFEFLEGARDRYRFEALIGETYPLEKTNEAVEAALTGGGIRVAVRP